MEKIENSINIGDRMLIFGLISSFIGIITSVVATVAKYGIIDISINYDNTFIIGVGIMSIGVILIRYSLDIYKID